MTATCISAKASGTTGISLCCKNNYALCKSVTHIQMKKINLQLWICKPHVHRNQEMNGELLETWQQRERILVLYCLPLWSKPEFLSCSSKSSPPDASESSDSLQLEGTLWSSLCFMNSSSLKFEQTLWMSFISFSRLYKVVKLKKCLLFKGRSRYSLLVLSGIFIAFSFLLQSTWPCTPTSLQSRVIWPSGKETSSWSARRKASGGTAPSGTARASSPATTSNPKRQTWETGKYDQVH